jgi:hypothetical protein
MKRSLAHLPSAGNLYLYLLVDDGSLYPVHPLVRQSGRRGGCKSGWG